MCLDRIEEAHLTLEEEGTVFFSERANLFSEFSCSLCSLLQADESRREAAHSTPGEERAVSFLNLVVPFALCCRRMKADFKKHI